MAHIVLIEDKDGDVVDQAVFCSDFCAQEHADYAGWSGCAEISVSEPCESCGEIVEGLNQGDE